MIRFFSILAILFFATPAVSQNDTLSLGEDTVAQLKTQKKAIYSSARKASIMSAILPGLGQAYNKKYWKIPIIYAGLGGFGYMFLTNNKQYNIYRSNVIAYNDNDSTTVPALPEYSSDQSQVLKLQYRKYRDFSVIGFTIIYLINIIDANVDAHLKTFDVSDDLSLHVDPWQSTYKTSSGYRTATGISLKLTFK
ncbi:MAG: DUF5683 domain-containing protein [Bacteroidota bacterium]|nr:DUF5683 domain-containing protein [Bacteroidota bacterium]MDP3146196.1 DUF5683 domain-containing protein [Bacteroidota bacterium]MDP3556651.1 DUF5683 domain-containing protein [Bacteroidota bacterium]